MNTHYDTDSDDEDNNDVGVSTGDVYDPERNERINRMMEASNDSAFDILQDDQVTDFVLRMAEKNEKMVSSVTEEQPGYPVYTTSEDSEEDNGDDLDESYNMNSMKQRRHQQFKHSPDEYPPGDAYGGDEVEEDADIPSYDPKDEEVLSYYRLCCVACALIICMIAVSVIILVFIVVLDDEENPKTFDGMILPIAPSNLKDVCSFASLKAMQGEMDCREPCMEAACCWEKGETGQDPACWQSHPLECAPYESCVNLLHSGSDPRPQEQQPEEQRPTSTIPRAPDGVDSCDPNSIDNVEEVLLCESACNYGTCCWKQGESLCVTDPNCLEYKPCEILNPGGAAAVASGDSLGTTPPIAIPTAAGNLEQVCSQASTKEDCQEYCQKATCCWKMAVSTFEEKDGGTVTESLLGACSNRSECAAYKPCQVLNWGGPPGSGSVAGAATTHVVPKAPSNLAEACNAADTGEVDSYELCLESCHAAACCWKTATTSYKGVQGETIAETVQGSCSFKEECEGYTSCSALPGATASIAEGTTTVAPASSIPEPPADLQQLCTNQSVETCRAVCNDALCCWKMATTSHVGAQGETVTEAIRGSCSSHAECEVYNPCLELPEASTSGTNTVAAASSNLEAVCSPSGDQMDSIQECLEFCSEATCCWKMATTSYQDANNATVTTSVAGTCSHKPECTAYKACSVLDDDVLSPHTPAVDPTPAPVTTPAGSPTGGSTDYTESMIYDACYNHVDQPGQEKTMCEVVCEAGACCYQSGQTCASGFECTKYEPCGKLVQDADASKTEPTEVETACQNTSDLADCVALCSDVTCCFTQDLEKSCDVVNPETVCSEYTPCEVIYQGGNNR